MQKSSSSAPPACHFSQILRTFIIFLRLFASDWQKFCTFASCFARDTDLFAHLSLSNHHLGKENEQKSKYAEVAHYSADFSIAYLGLVVSLREIWQRLRYFYLIKQLK